MSAGSRRSRGGTLRVDGAGAPLPPVRGGRRRLVHDPFAPPGAPQEAPARAEPAAAFAALPLPARPAPGDSGAPTPLPRRRLDEVSLGELPEGLLALLGEREQRRLAALQDLAESGMATDALGLSPAWVRRAFPLFFLLHRVYFRVSAEGREHLPKEGAAVLAANHGGLLPFDGAMAVTDVLLHSDPPRIPRALMDRFVARVPGLREGLCRLGQVVGTRDVFRHLLAAGEMVLVFPEGLRGIAKPLPRRHDLAPFHPGFVQEALRARAPILPLAVVGAERQQPMLADLRFLARALRLPFFPVTPTFPWLGPLGLLPLPVHYHLIYGPPFLGHLRHGPEAADDAALTTALAAELRGILQRMLDRGRRRGGRC